MAKESVKLNKFMNIWEIEPNFKCPVVGAMLSVDKHKNILKRCGYNVKLMKPYEYHQQIMGRLQDENNVSVKVNNFIRSQAHRYMAMIDGQSDETITKLWKQVLGSGNVGPMMYAIVSYEDAGIELLHDVHGQVHMLAHANMTAVFDAKKQIACLDTSLEREHGNVLRKNDEIKRLSKVNKENFQKIQSLEFKNSVLEKQLADIQQSLPQKNHHHRREDMSRELNRQIKNLDNRLMIKEREKRALEIDGFSLKDENRELKREIHTFLSNFQSSCTSPSCASENTCLGESCPEYQLCAKRIFMVGGITKMKSFYKKIVENAGGEFHYHDGYFRQGKSNVEAMVKKCDMILCPVNCNSHNACLKVKKMCAQHNKKIKFLKSSSLTAVTRALFEEESTVMIN